MSSPTAAIRTDSHAAGPRSVALIVLLATLTVMGPLSVDFVFPVTAPMIAGVGAPENMSASAITAAFLGVGVGQFFWGPVSDRYGRRGPLLFGIAIFVLASIGCAAAPTAGFLITCRAIEGFCAGSGMVIGRAILRDLFRGPALARIYTRLIIPIAFTSVLGPILGSLISEAANWRWVFVAIAAIGVALGILSAILLPETVTAAAARGRGFAAARAYLAPMRERNFLVPGGVVVVGSVTMFTCFTSLSTVLQQERGLDSVAFALAFAVNNIAILCGSQLAGFISRFVVPRMILLTAVALSVTGCAATLLVVIVDGPLWVLQAALFAVTFQQGAIGPVGTAVAVDRLQGSIGAGVAAIGGLQYLVGSIIAGAVAAIFGTSSLIMAIGMTVTSASALLIAILGRKA